MVSQGVKPCTENRVDFPQFRTERRDGVQGQMCSHDSLINLQYLERLKGFTGHPCNLALHTVQHGERQGCFSTLSEGLTINGLETMYQKHEKWVPWGGVK